MDSDLRRGLFDTAVTILSLVAAFLLIAHEAAAASPAPQDTSGGAAATWRAECGSCHVAYPARLLPPSSWRALMQDLDRHFGVNASVAPAETAAIGAYLAANGGREFAGATRPPITRITQTPWFVHEHGKLARRGGLPTGSLADCAACHRDAARGDFDERSLLIPH